MNQNTARLSFAQEYDRTGSSRTTSDVPFVDRALNTTDHVLNPSDLSPLSNKMQNQLIRIINQLKN